MAKVAEGVPKSEDLISIVGELESQDSERDELIKELRELRFGDNEISLPVGMESEIVRSNTAYTVVEHVVGSLTADDPVISVPAASESRQDEERASKMERVTSAALKELERQQGEEIKDRFIESLVADGHGAMRMFYAPQLWKGYPKRKKDEDDDGEYIARTDTWKRGHKIPIHWMWLDPLTVHPVWGESGMVSIVEHDKRNLADLSVERWNIENDRPLLTDLAQKDSGGKSNGEIDFVQYWTKDTVTYMVNERIVHHAEHKYTRPPYVYSTGITPSVREKGRRGLSVLYPLRYLVPYLDRLLSQSATGIRLWNWPTPVVHLDPAMSVGGEPRTIEVRPGKTVSLYTGEDISFLVWQGSPPDSAMMTQMVQSMIQKAGLSDVFYGGSMSGDSGYLINQLLAAARVKFRPIVANAERAMEDICQLFWDIVEYQIKDDIHIFAGDKRKWYTIGPDDLNGYRQVRVSISPLLPTDTYATSSRVINEVGASLRDISSAMEEIGIGQPDEMKQRILVDKIVNSEPIQAILMEEAARRYGLQVEQAAPQIPAQQLQQDWGSFPPALQQAIAAYAMSQQGGGQQAAPVMAGPNGQQAIPTPPGPPGNALAQTVQPAGIAGGMAPGPQMTGQVM
jgi:hypothetical protein